MKRGGDEEKMGRRKGAGEMIVGERENEMQEELSEAEEMQRELGEARVTCNESWVERE